MNTKAFQQIASALIFRFVANLANEVLPSLLLDLVGSEDHGFLVDLMVKLHVYEDGDPLDPKIDLDVTTQELALETTRQGLTDFVNGAFDGMRELGFADDFEDTRRGLLELAVEENLNMDINASSFATRALYGQDDPDGWGPGLAIKVKMDMNAEVDAWDQEERAAAGVDKEDDEELDNFPQMPFKPWGGECLTGKSWIGATKTCRSFTMSQRNLQNEMDVNDMSFEQSMQLFGSWVHMALKRAFPAFFRVPLAGKILSTDAMWKDSCRYAMMALPSGEWWSPILVAFEILQIHTKGVAELHRIWNGLSFRAAVRQTHYEHPDAGQMIAMSEADGEEGLQIRFAGKWNELLELVPPGILYM
ncbi:unnamed protein product [Symbiodinium pilosum]|uniref:Uncharacterized protein n=1 Tax=Symbiodinium pilosum TaxID=2952 RepID=A0A812WRR2_SYMPI|nr:unnamed protein product [Symbiodinium pilosum]